MAEKRTEGTFEVRMTPIPGETVEGRPTSPLTAVRLINRLYALVSKLTVSAMRT